MFITIEIKNENEKVIGTEDINPCQIASIREWKDKKNDKIPHTAIIMSNSKRYIIAMSKEEFKAKVKNAKET